MRLDQLRTDRRTTARTAVGVGCFVAALGVAWFGSPGSTVVELQDTWLVQAVVCATVVLLAGAGWLLSAPDFTGDVVETVRESPLRSLGYGVLVLLLTVVLGGVALGTLAAGGVPLLALPAVLFAAVLPLLGVLGALALARRVTDAWRSALLGSALLGAVSYATPYVGTLAWVGFVCAGLGATYLHVEGPGEDPADGAGSGEGRTGRGGSGRATVLAAGADDRYLADRGGSTNGDDGDGPERR